MSRHTTAARAALVALLATLLVPLSATATQATPGCVEETPGSILQDGCDDSSPPETSVTASVTPNPNGLVNVSGVTFTLAHSVTDGDPGPFGFECRLTGTPDAHDWQACPPVVTLTGLPDAAAMTYVFEARAVDLGDTGRNPDTVLGPGTVVDSPDYDQSPARVAWGQDTKAPFVFVTQAAYDDATPTQPVVTGDTVPIRLNASEPGATFECTDNGAPVACSQGRWELADPAPGRHTFTARVVDRAGNASAWAAPIEFFVPLDLEKARGWKRVSDDGYFRGDALRATKRGARLVLPRTEVGELRLLAATGPGLGKVRVRVARRDWHVVDLSGPKAALEQFVVIDRYSGVRTGRITIESLSDRPVVVDAVVARLNRFPAGH